MKDSLKKFTLLSLLAATPIIAFVTFYAISDPFHVVHPITKTADGRDSVIVGNNTGFATIETFLTHNKAQHYDSFIFGSSMAQNFKTSYWKPYIDSTASTIHFDASGETLDGIINKMQFLNRHGSQIKNALIIMEERMLHRPVNNNSILYAQHPATTGYHNWFNFHTIFFNAFRNFEIIDNTLNNRPLESLNEDTPIPDRIEIINEYYYAHIDSILAVDPSKFFTPSRLAKRSYYYLPQPIKPAIDETVEAKLRRIKSLLDKNDTHYIIIVPPCNKRLQLMEEDLWILKSIFGQQHVHNFSSMDKYVGNELYYYDNNTHLISSQCKLLVDSAYKEEAVSAVKNPYYEKK